MWELISLNKRKCIVLMTGMAALLLAIGAALGLLFDYPLIGVAIAAGVWVALTGFSFVGGDKMLLSASGATPVTKEVHPQLYNVVEEMTIAASLSKMPKLYIIDDPAPNAFATGRNPDKASIAVTSGLLAMLDRDELQGVVAHEMSHILHRDILYVTLAGAMVGTIIVISEIIFRVIIYGHLFRGSGRSSRMRSSAGRGGAGGGGGVIVVYLVALAIAILAAILAPIFAQILYFSVSRHREYLADAEAVRLTRYPRGLASALSKIATMHWPMKTLSRATAPMYIANPYGYMQTDRRLFGLGSTHPPMEKRIQVLLKMSSGAGYGDYAASYASVMKKPPKLPASLLKDSEKVAIRHASADRQEPPPTKPAARKHAADDIIRKANNYKFTKCSCGVKLKIPPALLGKAIKCPRCSTRIDTAA